MTKKLKSKLLIFLILLLAISYMLFANAAQAQILKGIVPCGKTSDIGTPNQTCTVCHLFVLIKNLIDFMLYVAAPLVTLAAIFIAFLFMFSGGSPAKISDAKGKLRFLIIGIFWVFGSWLVISSILNFFADKKVFPWPWNKISCEVSQPASQPTGASGGAGIPSGKSSPFEGSGGQFGGGGTTVKLGSILSEQEARNQLQRAGIIINKNPCPAGVPYQNVSGGCTSLNGIKSSTVQEAIQLKKSCNCTVEITGVTELGHEQGTVSHANGDKLDFRPNSTLDQYIQNNFTYIGLRSDGARQYQASNGTIMAKEGDHWDATVVRW